MNRIGAWIVYAKGRGPFADIVIAKSRSQAIERFAHVYKLTEERVRREFRVRRSSEPITHSAFLRQYNSPMNEARRFAP